jgi:hypothetical protein
MARCPSTNRASGAGVPPGPTLVVTASSAVACTGTPASCPSAVSHAADAFQPGGRTVPLPGREDLQPWPRKRPRRALLDRRLRDVADPTHPFLLGPPLSAGTHSVDSVAFSPYGHTLASGDDDGTSPTRHIPCRWPVSRPASPPSPWRSAPSAARWPAPASSSTCSISLPTPFTPAARQVPEPRHQGGVLGGVQPTDGYWPVATMRRSGCGTSPMPRTRFCSASP